MMVNLDKPLLLAVNDTQQSSLADMVETPDDAQEQRIAVPGNSRQTGDIDLSTQQVKEFDSPPQEEDSSILGGTSAGFLIGALVLNVIFLLIVLFCCIRVSDLKERYIKLKEKSTEQKNKLEDLTDRVTKLEKNFEQLNHSAEPTPKANSFTLKKDTAVTNYNGYHDLSLPAKSFEVAPPPVTSQPATSRDESKSYTSDFNALAEKSGYEFNQAKKEFVNRYRVRAFSCTNHEERMNEPIPAPTFAECEVAFSGEYWAVPLQATLFYVFPNINTYTNNFHFARAMGEVFKSNFEAGRTYGKIIVETPAVFERSGTSWKLKKQGVLRLR